MKYKKAQEILPKHIIEILQEYVDGEYLYIPIKSSNKKSWGEKSGLKKELSERNRDIFNKYQKGISIKQLTNQYYLTESSIRRIIREEENKV
ncbi:CD3324 family protein [Clostridium sp.]|uniref:CD3324 family protein n=1 Tax=Clostridium sp. TaxID=1506 RepID=UPI003F3011E6